VTTTFDPDVLAVAREISTAGETSRSSAATAVGGN